MPINSMEEMFKDELKDIYDAEHQFLEAQEEMLASANDPQIKKMIKTHMEQTENQITNLRKAFSQMGWEAQRKACEGAKGIVREGQKMLKETASSPELRDIAILSGASKVEHYEMSAYRGLIESARLMGQKQIEALLSENLRQEEDTAQLIEQTEPKMLRKAMSAAGSSVS